MNARTFLRVAVVTAGSVAMLAATSPALAQKRDDGDEPGPQLNALQNLLLYIGAPLGLFLLIALLVLVPSIVRGPRYRPGLSWWAPPVWFGAPAGAGGAATAATSPADLDSLLSTVEPTRDGGGAGARW